MDEALEYLQLLELAIELGYINESDARPVALGYMKNLLWSFPAWKFVDDYEYVSVQFLAARFGLHSAAQAPEIDYSGEVRFASALSSHTGFRENRSIGTWTAFLDDYVQEKDEQDEFYEFLGRSLDYHKTKLDKPSNRTKRRHRLLQGLVEFVDQLSSALSPLNDSEMGRVGTLYSYWLAKFFGYELSGKGYVKDKVWEDDSWAEAALRAPILSLGAFTDVIKDTRNSDTVASLNECVIKHGIMQLRSAWGKTQEFICEHRKIISRKGVRPQVE